MMAPKTTWYVLEDIDGLFEYSPKRTHDMEGSYAPGDTLSVKIQLWIRYGRCARCNKCKISSIL